MRWFLLVLALGCGSAAQPKLCDTFDRVCAIAADCAVLSHQTDCCGSKVVIGVASKNLDADQSSELACSAQFQACECAGRAPVAEDGKLIPDSASLKVRCTSGRCSTFVN